MGLIARKELPYPPNSSPVWSTTPFPAFTAGTADTYSLSDNTFDAEGDTLTYSLAGGSLPSGITLGSNGVLTADGTQVEGTATGITVNINDGVNPSVTSPSFSIQVLASSSIRWNPGYYVLADGSDPLPGDDHLTNAQLDEAAAVSAIVGVKQVVRWVQIEPSKGVYDFDFIVDTYNRCAARGLYFMLEIFTQKYNSTNWSNYLPGYLDTDYSPGIYAGTDSNGVLRSAAALDNPDVMDRLILAANELGDVFDPLPFFEGVHLINETSIGFSLVESELATQYARLCQETVSHFTQSNRFLTTNWMQNDVEANWNTVFAAMETYKVGGGGTDPILNKAGPYPPDLQFSRGEQHFLGMRGTKDYSGIIPFSMDVQSPSYGGKEGDWTPEELATASTVYKKATHVNFMRSNWTPYITWSADVLPYLQGTPVSTVQTYPSSY